MISESDDRMLSAWLDGELSGREAEELQGRLRNEDALAKRLELLTKASSSMSDLFSQDAKAVVAKESVKEEFIRTTFSGEIGKAFPGGSGSGAALRRRGPIIFLALIVVALTWLGWRYLDAESQRSRRQQRIHAALNQSLSADLALGVQVTNLTGDQPASPLMRIWQSPTGQWRATGFAGLGLPPALLQPSMDRLLTGSQAAPAHVAFDGRRLWAAPTKAGSLIWKAWNGGGGDFGVLAQLPEIVAPIQRLKADRELWLAAIAALRKAAQDDAQLLPPPLEEKLGTENGLRVDLPLDGLEGIVRLWVVDDETPKVVRIAFGSWRLDFELDVPEHELDAARFAFEGFERLQGLTIKQL